MRFYGDAKISPTPPQMGVIIFPGFFDFCRVPSNYETRRGEIQLFFSLNGLNNGAIFPAFLGFMDETCPRRQQRDGFEVIH